MSSLHPFMLLIKPAGADCNLSCEYCFYLDKSRLYPESRRHRMGRPVLERLIGSYLATEQPQYVFCWQGGEPTLMGLDFFRHITDLQQRYGHDGAVVANSLQTNATLIDDDLAAHLARYRFLVGCSLDGPGSVHDRYRRSRGGNPSHAATLQGIEVLRRHGVAVNILVLVSQANVRRAREVYRYLTDRGFLHQQYIPCVEFTATGDQQPFAVDGEEWGEFLCELFDVWQGEDVFRVSIRDFDACLERLVTGKITVCTGDRNCCRYFVVEHNGDIYPCDFFVSPEHRLGNIRDLSWAEARVARGYRDFGALKANWNEACEDCACLELCHGDCLKFRPPGGRWPRSLSSLCAGWRRFHEHSRARFAELAGEFRARQVGTVQEDRPHGVGRNDPCPCGSGRKYKRCCAG